LAAVAAKNPFSAATAAKKNLYFLGGHCRPKKNFSAATAAKTYP
jgi:hypothetical protein